MFAPARARPAVSPVRMRFGTMSAQRRSSRSTMTPANGDRAICGSTNETSSALTALLDWSIEDEDGQRIERHVAADLVRGLDEPQPREDRIAEDAAGAGDLDRHGARV